MPSIPSRIFSFIQRQQLRIAVYFLLCILTFSTSLAYASFNQRTADLTTAETQRIESFQATAKAWEHFRQTSTTRAEYQAKNIDTTSLIEALTTARTLILAGKTSEAEAALVAIDVQLATLLAAADKATAEALAQAEAEKKRLEEEAARKAEINGTITTEGKALSGVAVILAQNKAAVAQTASDAKGAYSLNVAAGKYVLTASKSGYTSFTKEVELVLDKPLTLTIAMTKVAPTPTPIPKTTATPAATPSSSQSNDYSTYSATSVSTSRGTFNINMITVDLTKAKVITDTATSSDCTNCPAQSLATYVSNRGGFAGINGTYFCPPDYAECASTPYWFFYMVYATRISRMINQDNRAEEAQPVMAFSSTGTPRYFSSRLSYHASGYSPYAAIHSKPRLIEGGRNVLPDSDMDSKQRTTKSNRGALGFKGNTVYAVIAKSANIPDLAAVMEKLGVDYAINLDGGGSSAMYYGGGYKVGPGRLLPNAVIFAAR